MKAKLTDFAIQKLKAKERPYELMDTEVKGLAIRIMGKPKAEVKASSWLSVFRGRTVRCGVPLVAIVRLPHMTAISDWRKLARRPESGIG